MDVHITPPIHPFTIISSNSHYSSAPTSPTRLTDYCDFDELLLAGSGSGSHAAVPFAWEEKPGVPKTPKDKNLFEDQDFSFDVRCEPGRISVAAEDLFDRGVIKTVNLVTERGRERGVSSSSRFTSSRSRRTRSLSPLGVSDYRRDPAVTTTTTTTTTARGVCGSCENGSKRWSFKDLFLFRSASDGSAMEKYPLKKYFTMNRKSDQELRNSCESGSYSKRRGRVSGHELRYNLNRANSNEMKKKTYLPYKQGILGGFSFN